MTEGVEGPAGFGGRVVQARLELGARRRKTMSQAELAKAMKVSPAAVSSWELGERAPALDTIARLAQVLQVSPGWLAFGEIPDQAMPPEINQLSPADVRSAEELADEQDRGGGLRAS